MIEQQAKLQPERIALGWEGGRMSFGEMNRRASRLALYLQSLGATREIVVGICLERSPDFVVAALAIFKCGGAYLPMDPGNPADRLRFIASDSGTGLVVTTQKFSALFAGLDVRVVLVDADQEVLGEQLASPPLPAAPDDLAYVIYTSGSTGEPKGVEITQRNLAHLIAWHVRAFALDASSRTSFLAGVGFDAAVWEIWPTLGAGGELHLPNEEIRTSPRALRDWLVEKQITHAFVPTALVEELITLDWPNDTKLHYLLTGADTLQHFPPRGLPFQLVNNYGPTECTVVSTSGIVPPAGEGRPSIGRPIEGMTARIIDGEIYLGGDGVARGYRNRPELTEERFVRLKGERCYRTGDLGRLRADGEIEFLGRRDDQIKIRGFRIELNEINAAISQHPSVRNSIVLAREASPNEKKLVAYVVPRNSFHDEPALREAIARRLPDYMMPSAFVFLESLPLNANGKIDRAALPPPNAESATEFVAPRSATEETLAVIIAEVLKVPRLSIHDDIFHLGAHSLLGAQVIAKVREVFGAELRLLDVFDAPTVAELSVKIENALTAQLEKMSDADVEAALAQFENVAG